MNRVDMAQIEKMLDASKEEMPAATGQKAPEANLEPIADEIEFGDFAKVDLRVVRIVKAEHVDAPTSCFALPLTLERASATFLPASNRRTNLRTSKDA